ncbi:MAG: tetratricopeptide repeat protein [Candidatus Ratteibacteria bacterium]|nr:tetratricopeptide repeat protein [Candidatus Ratteibacteria bacterium]
MEQEDNLWLEERKDEFLRDCIKQFFNAYLNFKDEYRQFKKEGKVKFASLAEWIGTEENKGPLWNLKDLAHNLLDKPHQFLTHEIGFERAMHLIFHQLMSFKEHVYVLEQYENIVRKRLEKTDEELSEALGDFKELMTKIKEEMPGEIESARELFETSLKLLKLMLPSFKNNKLVVRYVVENKELIEEVYGEGQWEEILDLMFNKKMEEAYYIVSLWYFENGDYNNAHSYIKKAVQLNPNSEKIGHFSKKVSAFLARK